jgi:predicted nucleic acid-binding protein
VKPAEECRDWYRQHFSKGTAFFVPEIADYEVRRELTRLSQSAAIARLDALCSTGATYLPITTAAIRRAAQMWAHARQSGRPTADPKELDADVILAAQAAEYQFAQTDTIVATSNVGHLSLFVRASDWRAIS